MLAHPTQDEAHELRQRQAKEMRDLLRNLNTEIERNRTLLETYPAGHPEGRRISVLIEQGEGNVANLLRLAETDGVLHLVAPDVSAPPTPPPRTVVTPVTQPVFGAGPAQLRSTPNYAQPRTFASTAPVQPSATAASVALTTHTPGSPPIYTRSLPYADGMNVALTDQYNREATQSLRPCEHAPGALHTVNRLFWTATAFGFEAAAGLFSRMIQQGHTPFEVDRPFRAAARWLFKSADEE